MKTLFASCLVAVLAVVALIVLATPASACDQPVAAAFYGQSLAVAEDYCAQPVAVPLGVATYSRRRVVLGAPLGYSRAARLNAGFYGRRGVVVGPRGGVFVGRRGVAVGF